MIRLYITKFTHTGTSGSYVVSNPMHDKFKTLTDVGSIELSNYYAEQDPITRLPKTDVVVCVLRGDSVIDGIQLAGVQQLPTGKKDKLISALSNNAKNKIKTIVQTIDPDVDLAQFIIIYDVILYIIRSVNPTFTKFGNGYDDGVFE